MEKIRRLYIIRYRSPISLCKKRSKKDNSTVGPRKSPSIISPSLHRCKQYQDGNDGSVKTFGKLSIKEPTNVANETLK